MTNLKAPWTLEKTSTGSYWLIDSDGFSDLLKSKNAAKIYTALNTLPAVLELLKAVDAWETDMHGNANDFFEQDIALVAARDALRAALGESHDQ